MIVSEPASRDQVADGDHCAVVGGTHAGKSWVVQDRKVSATGHVTVTLKQDGVRFKTLAKNVQKSIPA